MGDQLFMLGEGSCKCRKGSENELVALDQDWKHQDALLMFHKDFLNAVYLTVVVFPFANTQTSECEYTCTLTGISWDSDYRRRPGTGMPCTSTSSSHTLVPGVGRCKMSL